MARCFLILALGCLAPSLLGSGSQVLAQQRAPSIAFRNDLKMAVIVQGATDVKGMQRRGQALVVQPTQISYDTNLPPGDRIITIYDANQPSKVLYRDRVPVRNADLQFVIVLRQAPGSSPRIVIVPDTNP